MAGRIRPTVHLSGEACRRVLIQDALNILQPLLAVKAGLMDFYFSKLLIINGLLDCVTIEAGHGLGNFYP